MKCLFAFCFCFLSLKERRSALKESSRKGVVCTGLLSQEKKDWLVFALQEKEKLCMVFAWKNSVQSSEVERDEI